VAMARARSMAGWTEEGADILKLRYYVRGCCYVNVATTLMLLLR